GEDAPLPAGEEMRRLTSIRPARFDLVVGPERNVDRLLRIPVVVTDEERSAAVGIVEPAFVRAGDARAEAAPRLGDSGLGLTRQKNAAGERSCERAGGDPDSDSDHCCFSSLVVLAVFARRSATSALYSSSLK